MNAFNPSRGRAARKAATHAAVLAAARAEFEAVGFEAANLRAIAARAGVAAGTVVHHYGDKRELLHAALFEELDATLRRALARPGEGPLDQQLDRLARAALRFYSKRPQLSRTQLKEALFSDPPWATRFAGQAAMVSLEVARWVAAAVARGELRPDVDAELVSAAWLSFFYFALIAWTQGSMPAPARVISKLMAQHLDGLRPASRTTP